MEKATTRKAGVAQDSKTSLSTTTILPWLFYSHSRGALFEIPWIPKQRYFFFSSTIRRTHIANYMRN